MTRLLYNVLWLFALPFVLLRLILRVRHEPVYLEDILQRLGCDRAQRSKGAIWLHAVSVGETRAAAPLLAALRARLEGFG